MTVALTVNGETRRVDVDPDAPLLLVLRHALGLTGAKHGCGLEQCGACAVLVDGRAALTCATPAGAFEGRDIRTVEGLAGDGVGSRVIEAFAEQGASQCGACTPGIVIALTALLRANPAPTETDIRAALTPHLCRCGAHPRVLRAARALASGGR